MGKITQRFLEVWKTDFLAKFFAGEYRDTKTTILFWIFSQLLISLIITLQIFFYLWSSRADIIQFIHDKVPENAVVSIADGQLNLTNIDDPFYREINAEKSENNEGSFVFIIDTKKSTYDMNALDEYNGGLIVLQDRLYLKDGNEINELLFSELPNLSLSTEQSIKYVNQYYVFPVATVISLLFLLFITVFYICGRLVMALWWALMLFVIALIFDIKISYAVAYKAVLNLYFVPAFVVLILMLFNIHIMFLMSALFIVIFIANILWYKKNNMKEEKIIAEDLITKEDGAESSVSNSMK